MADIVHGKPSAFGIKVLEIRLESYIPDGKKNKRQYYTLWVDEERIASVFGPTDELPRLVLPSIASREDPPSSKE